MGDGRDLNFVQGHAHVLRKSQSQAGSLNPVVKQRVAGWVTSQRWLADLKMEDLPRNIIYKYGG